MLSPPSCCGGDIPDSQMKFILFARVTIVEHLEAVQGRVVEFELVRASDAVGGQLHVV